MIVAEPASSIAHRDDVVPTRGATIGVVRASIIFRELDWTRHAAAEPGPSRQS